MYTVKLKKVSLFMALIIIVSCFGTVGAYAGTGCEKSGKWYDTAAEVWYEAGILKGDTDGNLRCDDNITRAEFISIVNRLLDLKYDGEFPFEDISNSDWYSGEIATAYRAGYFKGVEKDGLLYAEPDKSIIRQDAAVLLYRIFGLENYETEKSGSFSDYGDVSEYAKSAVSKMAGLEFINGYGDKTFKPLNNITRAETLTLLSKIAGEVKGKLPDVFSSGTVTVIDDTDLGNANYNRMFVIAKKDIKISNANSGSLIFNSADNSVKNLNIENSNIQAVVLSGECDFKTKNSKAARTEIYADAKISSEGGLDDVCIMNASEVFLSGSFSSISLIGGGKAVLNENTKAENIVLHKKCSVAFNENALSDNISIYEKANDSVITGNIDISKIKSIGESELSEIKVTINDKGYSLKNNILTLSSQEEKNALTHKSSSHHSSVKPTEAPSETEAPVQFVAGAYMADGFLYIKSADAFDDVEVHRLIDNTGSDVSDVYTNVHKIKDADFYGFTKYCLYRSGDMIRFDDGKYEIEIDGEVYPVVSLLNYRVDSGKRTENANKFYADKKISFCDYVYPVVFNADAYDNISFEILGTSQSLNPEKWPQILRDGMKEEPGEEIALMYSKITENEDLSSDEIVALLSEISADEAEYFLADEGEGIAEGTVKPRILNDMIEIFALNSVQITYPKEANGNEPLVSYDVLPTETDGLRSLDHKDRLNIKIDSDIINVYFWDQISKVWYQERTADDHIDMVYINGGEYLRGDWRDTRVSYAGSEPDPKQRKNINRLWLDLKDPQFMENEIVSGGGTAAVGKEALGVTGLKDEDSLAVDDKNGEMWISNTAYKDSHYVKVSDFMIGKFEVTMDQFYSFVNETKGKPSDDNEEKVTYTIGEETYSLNQIAGYAVYAKRNKIRDNGYGSGSRPAIDINWYEAVEFCNWLSRKEGLEPCYTFVNIHNGKEEDGLTTVLFLDTVEGSAMQRIPAYNKDIQLVRVDCDFSKNGYRLPTESEYEYAARGGEHMSEINNDNDHGYYISGMKGEITQDNPIDKSNIKQFMWFQNSINNPQKSGESTASVPLNNAGGNGYSNPVGSKLPNILGVYDLTGNVWEACYDFFSNSYYGELKESGGVNENPTGPEYSIEQLSILDDYPVDPYMENEWQYTYELDDSGEANSYVRVGAVNLKYSGKLSHTFRGGCFTNPFILANSLNRFGPSQTYVQNTVNFTDARVGFRVARSVTDEDKSDKMTESEKREIDKFIDNFFKLMSSHNDYSSELLGYFNDDSKIAIEADGETIIGDISFISTWLKQIPREKANINEIMNSTVKKTNDGYRVLTYTKFYTSEDISSEDTGSVRYIFDIIRDDEKLIISNIALRNSVSEFAFS